MKKAKYYTEIRTNGCGFIRVCSRKEGIVKGFPSFVQIQIEGNDPFVNIRDEQIDYYIEALQNAKNIVSE